MKHTLLVPSDITLLEAKYAKGQRRLTLLERLGLMSMRRVYHWRYSKNDSDDLRSVLSRQFVSTKNTPPDPIIEILVTRQASIRKRVLAQNGMWMGAAAFFGLSWRTLRFYDYKAKLIVVPFATYGGTFVGRCLANLLTGRWSEDGRSRTLGELPAKSYYSTDTSN